MNLAWLTVLVLAFGMPLQMKNQNACDHAAPPAGMRWVCAAGNSCDCHLAPSKTDSRNDDEEFNASPESSRSASVAARIEFFVIPAYPDAPRRGQKQGMVSATLVLAPDGRVDDVKIQLGDAALASAARTAWQQWRFTPGNRTESIPVSMKFVLSKDAAGSVTGVSLLNTVVTASPAR
jgi:TonB family protein